MTKYPYPIDLNGVPLDRYLTNILSALVKRAGGKLAIAISDMIEVQDQVLLRYPTRNMKEIVLQLAPGNTDMYVVPEAPAWAAGPRSIRPATSQAASATTPVNPPTAPMSPPVTPPRIASTLDNLNLYLKEQEREETLRKIQAEDEVEQRRQAGLSPFRVIPGR